MFETDKAAAGGGDPESGDGDIEAIEGLNDKGKEAIRREREARKAAADDARAMKKQLDALMKEKADREAAEAKATEESAAARGEFEQLAKTRESERDQARQEAMTLKAENDQFREAIRLVIAVEWDKLPEEVREAFLGDDDDALGKLHFLPKAKVLAAKLAEKAEAVRGNGYDPKSSAGGKKSNDEAARKAQAAMYRQL